jgi:hypothetical protein
MHAQALAAGRVTFRLRVWGYSAVAAAAFGGGGGGGGGGGSGAALSLNAAYPRPAAAPTPTPSSAQSWGTLRAGAQTLSLPARAAPPGGAQAPRDASAW